MSNGEADVLSKIGVVAATTAQVETSVIERVCIFTSYIHVS